MRYIESLSSSSTQNSSDAETATNVNLYAFIYDALKHFPNFRSKIKEIQSSEMETWEEVVCNARNKGEIKSLLSDEQIASIFIYTNKGIGMDSILEIKSKDWRKQIASLWDTFYKTLKA